MTYIVSVHIPIAGISLLPVLAGLPIILHPVHIVFLELIIDPACSVVFEQEPAEADIMKRPPRDPAERLFNLRMLSMSLLQGVFALAAVAAVYLFAKAGGSSDSAARTLSFITLIVSNLALILSNRSWTAGLVATLKRKNRAFRWVLAGAALLLILVLFVPDLRAVFLFAPISPLAAFLATAAGLAGVLWLEVIKLFARRRRFVPRSPKGS